DFLSTMMQVEIVVPKNRSGGSWITASTKLLSMRYLRILCSAPPRYSTPGNSTIAAVPFTASHDKMCIVNARSALDFGASTPAGANRGSLMSSGFASPSHLVEYGGLDTIASKGSSSQCAGSSSVSPCAIENCS